MTKPKLMKTNFIKNKIYSKINLQIIKIYLFSKGNQSNTRVRKKKQNNL